MLCVVDTSVWVDFFNGRRTDKTKLLQFIIEKNIDLAYTGVILTEVLMGFRQEKNLQTAKDLFGKLIYLDTGLTTYAYAAEIYRKARKRGVTIRSTIDCLISATVIQNKAYLLENDRDFVNISKFSDLKLISRM